MSLHDGHRDRMRKQILQNGLASFPPHNALEILLYYTNPRKDTNYLAHLLIDHFGSFSNVLDASFEELVSIQGIGESTALFLKLLPQTFRYYLHSKEEQRQVVETTQTAADLFIPYFIGLSEERLYMASLNDEKQLIRVSKISEGITNQTAIITKNIITEAIFTNATAVILAHNHPAGTVLPSIQDKEITEVLKTALSQIHIELIDHLVISNRNFSSILEYAK